MNRCMGTDKPRVSILMAVYEPGMDWLREQLLSLNAQTYPNIKLYIRDDCSRTVSFEAIQSCVQDCIRAFPYEISRNEENLGSNKTFERLTQEADGVYFAYCDQDDIWLPEKLEKLERRLSEAGGMMAYCDMAVIDGDGIKIAEGLKELRPRLNYLQGSGLAERYFFRNCTAGCSMLMLADIARGAAPFLTQTVCDQWLAINAAGRGSVCFVDEALVLYRQHGGNQTGVLQGITDKSSYRVNRILPLQERIARLESCGMANDSAKKFVEARLSGDIRTIWKYRKFSPWDAMFEIMMHLTPNWFVKQCLRKIR